MEAKVQDYPNLVKRNGAVINVNHDDYVRAKVRTRQAHRIKKLETDVSTMDGKLTEILDLLKRL